MSKSAEQTNSHNVMKTSEGQRQKKDKYPSGNMVCYGCGKPGHQIAEFPSPTKRCCENCRNHTHDTKYCRKKKQHSSKCVRETLISKNNSHSARSIIDSHVHVENDEHDFAFKVSVDPIVTVVNSLLVDCCATTHIVHDFDKFTKFRSDFNPENHYIELADGRNLNKLALKRGDARVTLCDVKGNSHREISFYVTECDTICPDFQTEYFFRTSGYR